MSMPLVISAIVAVVLLVTHAGIALAIVRGVAGDDGEARGAGKRFFLRAALVLMALTLALVPVTAWMLAPAGLTTRTLAAIGLGQLCLLVSIMWSWRELAAPAHGSPRTTHAFGALVLFCVSLVVAKVVHQDETRHAYLVANPPKLMVVEALPLTTPPATTPPVTTSTTPPADVDPEFAKGEKVFKSVCIVCHALDTRLVGPPIRELVKDYQGNPDGIAAWAKAPGKKRPDYPPMIAVPLPDADLRAAGVYMLKVAETK
ncbi:MAG: cytochrome c [Planctomycetes bacterium]|nr:cytochrome c [Planctomycetota bacterium]